MSDYNDIFNNSGSVDKRMLNVGTQDYELIRAVFPEWGMITNLSQFLIRDAADKLRELGYATAGQAQEAGYTMQKYLQDISWKNNIAD